MFDDKVLFALIDSIVYFKNTMETKIPDSKNLQAIVLWYPFFFIVKYK